MRPRHFAYLGLAWLALIAVLALLPEPLKSRSATRGRTHRVVHVIAFFVASFTLGLASDRRRIQLLFCAGALLLGIALEALQVASYRNRLEFRDIGDDAIGAILGFTIRQIVPRRQEN